MAIISATHDIAVDGFYLESLDKDQQAKNVGYQAMSYRLALITGGGGLVWLSGKTSWPIAFGLASAIFAALTVFHYFYLPKSLHKGKKSIELIKWILSPKTLLGLSGGITILIGLKYLITNTPYLSEIKTPTWITVGLLISIITLILARKPLKTTLESSDSIFAKAFFSYIDQPKIGLILAFIITYRAGESFLIHMVYPMLSDAGMSRDTYGLIYGTAGIVASILGGILGGFVISKYGLKRTIWFLAAAQNVPNLLYAMLALFLGESTQITGINLLPVSTCVIMEAFGAGMGTASFMVFIMRTTKGEHKAAHMAIATAIMNITGTIAGVSSGFVASKAGFPLFFTISFVATIPGMLLIPWLPHLKGEK